MHITGANGSNHGFIVLRAQSEYNEHGFFTGATTNGKEALFCLGVRHIWGQIKLFLLEERLDFFDSKPMFLAFCTVPRVPVKSTRRDIHHTYDYAICPYECQYVFG